MSTTARRLKSGRRVGVRLRFQKQHGMVRIRQARVGHVENNGKRQQQRQGQRKRKGWWFERRQSSGEGTGGTKGQHRPRLQMLRKERPREVRMQAHRKGLRQLWEDRSSQRCLPSSPESGRCDQRCSTGGSSRSEAGGKSSSSKSLHRTMGLWRMFAPECRSSPDQNAKSVPGRKLQFQSRTPHRSLLFGKPCSI